MSQYATTFAQLSDGLIYSAIAVYALALLVFSAEAAASATARSVRVPSTASRRPLLGAVAVSLTALAVVLNTAAVVSRGVAAQRAPWGNMYEFVIVFTSAVGLAYLTFVNRGAVRTFGVWVVGLVLLGLGSAVTVLYAPVSDLVPVLDSYWLVIHVAAAIISGGVFSIGAIATLLFLIRTRQERRVAQDRPRSHRTSAASFEQVAHTTTLFAFPIWTFAVIAGAIWAENAWGRYWGWDPKETWAFITWVLYAAYLHAQSTAGWKGVKSAWFGLAGYLAFVFNFFGVNLWITGLHSYAGV